MRVTVVKPRLCYYGTTARDASRLAERSRLSRSARLALRGLALGACALFGLALAVRAQLGEAILELDDLCVGLNLDRFVAAACNERRARQSEVRADRRCDFFRTVAGGDEARERRVGIRPRPTDLLGQFLAELHESVRIVANKWAR